jgi:hypothetical protein
LDLRINGHWPERATFERTDLERAVHDVPDDSAAPWHRPADEVAVGIYSVYLSPRLLTGLPADSALGR